MPLWRAAANGRILIQTWMQTDIILLPVIRCKAFRKTVVRTECLFFFVLLCCKLPAYCKIYLTYTLQCKCIRRRTCSQWLSDIIVLPATQFAFALSVEHTQTDTDTYTKPKMFTKPTKWKQFSTRFDIVKVYMHYERNIYIRSHASH